MAARSNSTLLMCGTERAARSGCWQLSLFQLAHRLLKGRQPNLPTYASAVQACERASQWAWVLRLLSQVRCPEFRATTIFVSSLASACVRHAAWAAALAVLDRAPERDTVVCNITIAACSKGELWAEALQMMGAMKPPADSRQRPGAGPAADAVTFTSVASVCSNVRQWALALAVLGEMVTQSIAVNSFGLSTAITALQRGARWAEALELLSDASGRYLQPNAVAYNATISACERGLAWQQAAALLAGMPSRGLTPTMVTYNSTISASVGHWVFVLGLLEQARSLHLTPDRVTYSTAINACGEGAEWERAMLLLAALGCAGGERDAIVSAVAIRACARGEQWSVALRLLEEQVEASAMPHAPSFNAAMSACERGSQWQRALLLLDRLRGGAPLGTQSLNGAIQACVRGALWELALDFLAEAALPDEVSYSTAVAALAAAGAPLGLAIAVYREACDRGAVSHWKPGEPGTMDLHRYSLEMARLAVKAVILDLWSGGFAGGGRLGPGKDLLIVVGRGNHSGGQPLLEPALLEMLRKELQLGVAASRPGLLRVPSAVLWPRRVLQCQANRAKSRAASM